MQVINDDAFTWLEQHDRELFDIAIVDLPDPTNFSLGKLYTTSFYSLLGARVAGAGFAVVQTDLAAVRAARASGRSSPRSRPPAGRSFPYHATVPSFGVWGYIAAARRPIPFEAAAAARSSRAAGEGTGCASSRSRLLPTLFEFPADMARVPADVNRLHDQVLVQTYEAEWGSAPEH